MDNMDNCKIVHIVKCLIYSYFKLKYGQNMDKNTKKIAFFLKNFIDMDKKRRFFVESVCFFLSFEQCVCIYTCMHL